MALISCPDCGNQISSFAKICPNCGCPIEGSGNVEEAISEKKENIENIAPSTEVVNNSNAGSAGADALKNNIESLRTELDGRIIEIENKLSGYEQKEEASKDNRFLTFFKELCADKKRMIKIIVFAGIFVALILGIALIFNACNAETDYYSEYETDIEEPEFVKPVQVVIRKHRDDSNDIISEYSFPTENSDVQRMCKSNEDGFATVQNASYCDYFSGEWRKRQWSYMIPCDTIVYAGDGSGSFFFMDTNYYDEYTWNYETIAVGQVEMIEFNYLLYQYSEVYIDGFNITTATQDELVEKYGRYDTIEYGSFDYRVFQINNYIYLYKGLFPIYGDYLEYVGP